MSSVKKKSVLSLTSIVRENRILSYHCGFSSFSFSFSRMILGAWYSRSR